MTADRSQSRYWSNLPLPIGTIRYKPGGRAIVRVGNGHHLADKHGWAAEVEARKRKNEA